MGRGGAGSTAPSVRQRLRCRTNAAAAAHPAPLRAPDIEEITQKTGNYKRFSVFVKMLASALLQQSDSVFVDLLTYSDLVRAGRAPTRLLSLMLTVARRSGCGSAAPGPAASIPTRAPAASASSSSPTPSSSTASTTRCRCPSRRRRTWTRCSGPCGGCVRCVAGDTPPPSSPAHSRAAPLQEVERYRRAGTSAGDANGAGPGAGAGPESAAALQRQLADLTAAHNRLKRHTQQQVRGAVPARTLAPWCVPPSR